MKTTKQALAAEFKWVGDPPDVVAEMVLSRIHPNATIQKGYWSFKFGDGYELAFEPLIWDNQMYVSLYKDFELLTEKVVVKPDYIKEEDD